MSEVVVKNATEQIRIGKIHYLNTLPFYAGLTCDIAELTEGYPTQINELMISGALDIAPISSLAYAMNPERFFLLPGLCIGARSHSGSVLLFSRRKIENLGGSEIRVTCESLTGRALLDTLLRKRYGLSIRYATDDSAPEVMLKDSDACLSIGDSALFYEPREFIYKYDLSELWNEWLALPFCFSVWAVNRSAHEQNPEAVRQFHRCLKQNLETNLSQLPVLVEQSLGLSLADKKYSQVLNYLSHLQYTFDEPMTGALLRFFELCRDLGWIKNSAELSFIEENV